RVAVAASTTHGSGAGSQAGITAWDYFWTQGAVIWRYLAMTLIPVLPYRIDSPIGPGFYWYAWMALIGCCAWAARRFKSGGIWFLGTIILLLPSSSIFPAADLATDRRMYLALLPAAVLLASKVPHLRYALIVLAAISAFR